MIGSKTLTHAVISEDGFLGYWLLDHFLLCLRLPELTIDFIARLVFP